ncbi:MAG: hypothetical protein HYZ89_05445 [Candidatus Omnitrophica bacterium]|nr:hypothetical protein [Candidatus Omnitrophota bacterium]
MTLKRLIASLALALAFGLGLVIRFELPKALAAIGDITATGPNDEFRIDPTGRLILNASSPVTGIRFGTAAVDPPSIAANTTTNVNVTVAGLTTSDKVWAAAVNALEDGLVLESAEVTAANTLTLGIRNTTASAIDGASRNWQYLAVR